MLYVVPRRWDFASQVGFFGAGSMEDGSTFLVTEFMARGTLRDLLSQDFRGLLWERKIRFCLDVASGIFDLGLSLGLILTSVPQLHADPL